MTAFKIAAAQSCSLPGDISANALLHADFIATAHAAAVNLLVFPELSLSGYELPLLNACTVHPSDECLAPIRSMVKKTGMTVVVGAPLAAGAGFPAIAAFTFYPDGSSSIYRKQYLHPGEEQYVSAGKSGSGIHRMHHESFALAICADTAHQSHAQAAVATGASLYLAGVLVSLAGYAADAGNLQRYATQFNMGVLMANHGGPSGGYVSAGRSAFWAAGGKLVVAAPGTGNHLVVVSKESGEWQGEVLAVKT